MEIYSLTENNLRDIIADVIDCDSKIRPILEKTSNEERAALICEIVFSAINGYSARHINTDCAFCFIPSGNIKTPAMCMITGKSPKCEACMDAICKKSEQYKDGVWIQASNETVKCNCCEFVFKIYSYPNYQRNFFCPHCGAIKHKPTVDKQ